MDIALLVPDSYPPSAYLHAQAHLAAHPLHTQAHPYTLKAHPYTLKRILNTRTTLHTQARPTHSPPYTAKRIPTHSPLYTHPLYTPYK